MLRTPTRHAGSDEGAASSPPRTRTLSSKVRRSIGEWEAVGTDPSTKSPVTSRTRQAGPAETMTRPALSQGNETSRRPSTGQRSPKRGYANRTSEARACLSKAKQHLTASRNLKTDIKNGVTEAIDRLYELVKDLEMELKNKEQGKCTENTSKAETEQTSTAKGKEGMKDLVARMEEHGRLLQEHKEEMRQLQHQLSTRCEAIEESRTYASVAARSPSGNLQRRPAMHSVVVTSQNDQETGEQVLEKVKRAVNAREVGVKIDRVRQARDRKVIIGCSNKEEIRKVKDRIKGKGEGLNVEEVQNKDPLVIFYGVLKANTDEDIKRALKNQNGNLLGKEGEDEGNIQIRFRRRARNPHQEHVVARVTPPVWKRLTEAGAVHIDLQRIRVADQSPLVQCSRCLGYGHGKRFCREEVDACSHCGGPHLRAQCTGWREATTPECINCTRHKGEYKDHSAFSDDCPVRRKWEAIARSAIAYC